MPDEVSVDFAQGKRQRQIKRKAAALKTLPLLLDMMRSD
jgi:hypothetical protein